MFSRTIHMFKVGTILTNIIFVLLAIILLSGCGYAPVRIPFVVSGNNYKIQFLKNDTIRVLCWNVYKENNEAECQDEFKKIIDSKNPNIILLQEFIHKEGNDKFFSKDIKPGYEFAPNTYIEKYDAYSGVLTASSIKPVGVNSMLSNGLEPITDTSKIVLFTKYALNSSNKELLVVNVHAINFEISNNNFKEQLQNISKIVVEHDGPIIVAGDFNTWSQTRYSYLEEIIKGMNLIKIDFGSQSDDVTCSFGNPLDHIFYSENELELIEGSADVIDNIESSDHLPLFIELKVRNNNSLNIYK
ncbi:MAG: endonuclease/exonuclease/phosphatase family protein [Candidatus Delongbacteria bacterium]|nr:endonuclease/exonuclease/phosphatase family protein [Candidatus Delongbacteria bacterium]